MKSTKKKPSRKGDPTKHLLFEMCRADMEGRKFDVAIIPIGATEVHAWHLPFGNDTLHAMEIARRVADMAATRGVEILVLPAIPFGCSPDVMSYPVTLSVRPTTLFPLFEDLVVSLTTHGIRKIVFLSGHGGNNGAIEAFRREAFGKYGAFLVQLEWWQAADDVRRQVQETDEINHADEIETSHSLELCPHLVRMDVAEPTRGNRSSLPKLEDYGSTFLRRWDYYTKNGGVGDPTKATKEKGRKMAEAAVERITDALVELAELEYDDKFPYGTRRRKKK